MRLLPLLLLATALSTSCRPAEKAAEPPAPPPSTVSASTGAPGVDGAGEASPTTAYDPAKHEYVGSARCLGCHVEAHASWAKSSHATTVRAAEFSDEELLETFIECSDMPFSQVLGDRHHVRFLVDDPDAEWGAGRWLALPCGWDMHEKEVTLHHPEQWRRLPWENGCAGCHVTGFRPEDRGFLEFGVGCEECHGPSGEHADTALPGNTFSFTGRSAAEEVTVCASCHLQGGLSRSTGLKLPPHYRAGGPLFDDYEFDWSQLEQGEDAKVLDAHQKLAVRSVMESGDESLRCTSCHSLHGLENEKHRELPKQDYCLMCHEDDFSLKEYSQSCNVCEF